MEFLNGFISGTEKDSNSKNLIILVLIAILVLGFGKNGSSNIFGNVEGSHRNHRRHRRRRTCNCEDGNC